MPIASASAVVRSSRSRDREPSDAVGRPARGLQDRARRLRDVELEAGARRNHLDRVTVDGEVGVACGSADPIRERPEVRVGGGSTDAQLGRPAARQAEKLRDPH